MISPLLLVRLLPREVIGSYKIFFLYVAMLPVFSLTTGLVSGLGYWAGQGERGRRAIQVSNGLIFWAGLALALAALVASPWVTARFGWPLPYGSYLAVCLLGTVCANFLEESSIVTGRVWFGASFLSATELLRSLTVVLVAWLTRDLGWILLAYSLVSIGKTLASVLIGTRRKLFTLRPDRQVLGSVCRYSFPVSLAQVLGVFSSYGDQLILSNVITPAEFAVYAIGCLSIPPLLILEQSVTRLMVPELSASFAAGQSRDAARSYRMAVEQLTWLLIPAVTGLIVFALPIIELLFTRQYSASAGYLRWFALSYLILCVPSTPVPRALGDSKWILKNAILFTPVPLVLCFALGKPFGAYGVLAGILLSRSLMKAYALSYIRRATGWKWRDFFPFRDLVIFAGTSAVLGQGCLLLEPAFGGGLRWFLVCGTLFVALYFPISATLVNWRRRASKPDDGRRTNVLLFIQHLDIGGLERMVLTLGGALRQDRRWSVRVFCHDATENALGAEFAALKIPVEAFRKGPGFSFVTLYRLVRSIYRNRIDVIHSHDLGPLVYSVLANWLSCGRARLVHTQHSFVNLGTARRDALYSRIFARLVDRLVVVNDEMSPTYARLGVPKTRVQVVPNGVSFAEAPVHERAQKLDRRTALIASLPSSERNRIARFSSDAWILYLARLHSVKGQRDVGAVWASLDRGTRSRSTLLIVGPEAEPGEREQVIRSLEAVPDRDRVILLEGTKTPLEWLICSDLFLSCSRFEGMPLGPLEAIGSGLPSVLSAIPGHRFLSGFSDQYPPDKPADGALKIEAALGHPAFGATEYYAELWARSEPLRHRYSVRAMVESYARIYSPAD